MAEDEAQQEQADSVDADGESQGSSATGKKKIIMLAVFALLLVGLSVGGTLVALNFLGGEEVAPEEALEDAAEDVPEPLKPAIYYPLKPPIIVSFDAKGRQRLLQADLTLMTRDNDVIPAVETHMPMLRNALVMLMSGQLFEELQTAEGKELLRVQCLQELQRLLEQEIGKPGIEQVLFTNLVMQ